MSQRIEVKIPDIGDFKDVPVIDVMVKAGDTVEAEDPLITLESDKATIDVPSPAAGTIKDLKIKVGDKVSEGSLVLVLEADGDAQPASKSAPAPSAQSATTAAKTAAVAPSPHPSPARGEGESVKGSEILEVKIPDIGDFKDVPIIEVMVKPGDTVKAEDPLITLESDKATFDVPAPAAGTVKTLNVKVGDKVSEGKVVLLLTTGGETAKAAPAQAASTQVAPQRKAAPEQVAGKTVPAASTGLAPPPDETEEPTRPPPAIAMPGPSEMVASVAGGPRFHGSPSVRRFARELGVDVAKVKGSGPKGRITKEDVQAYVKGVMSAGAPAAAVAAPGGTGLDLLPWPKVDFAKFGPTETKPLSRIQKLSGANLARNWVMIPHVTQFDDADITELEEFRKSVNKEYEKQDVKVTMLAFLIKAGVAALKQFPTFNASLDGENLVLKHYFHVGFAADTPNGLVVPVIRNADQKSVLEIARESSALAKKARDGKLAPGDMQGGCFSISSLGGIGGTAFTPIINAPEVAILGVSKNEIKPVWDGKQFVPKLMLPLSLSYDHRVIDGATAARFITTLAEVLTDMRRAML